MSRFILEFRLANSVAGAKLQEKNLEAEVKGSEAALKNLKGKLQQ